MRGLDVRCEGDEALHKQLLENDEVQAVRRKLEATPGGGIRRRLLATAVRLTRSMSPRLHDMLTAARDKLGVEIPLESYVYNSPEFNAACIKPEGGTLLLMFSSSLLEKFDPTELSFVMGHELGHHLYAHHDIPIGHLVGRGRRIRPQLALQLFSWSRYAEISADRAGALCAEDANGAARALFKLASGLTSDLIEIRIDQFAAQADEMNLETQPGKDSRRQQDWFLTHPFTPVRVKALQLFFESQWLKPDGRDNTQVEAATHELMALMSPTYLEEKSEVAETMRRVLFAAGCGLMQLSGEITPVEIKAFEQLFGKGTFSTTLDLEGLEAALDQRIARAVETVPVARRVHILRDLCLIAVADGRMSEQERNYIRQIGSRLEVSPTIVEHCLERDPELD